MEVYIDPRSTLNYASFYIEGLYKAIGRSQIHFSSKYFKELGEIDMLLAFIVREKGKPDKRYIIDSRDQRTIIPQAYDWSDCYAKINFHKSETLTPDHGAKLKLIAPSFAIRIWNWPETLQYLIANFLKAHIYRYRNSPNIHLRPLRWARNYLTLLHRNRLLSYTAPQESAIIMEAQEKKKKYVFFLSTLWNKSPKVNDWRIQYLQSCTRCKNIQFEGGFFILPGSEVPANLPTKYQLKSYLSNSIYLQKIRSSAIVFNTPAVLNCHGWKLAEFLCMGKAIISTPLLNELPAPLEHKKHLYIIHSPEEMDQAVRLLVTDDELRHRLEQNARAYYEQYVAPEVTMKHLLYS